MLTWRPILWNMSYYFIKFQKYTKLTKTLAEQGYLFTQPIVCWDDIIGLEAAKRLVKEAVFYPIKELGC
ncbi:hypothetical protein cypCar_00045343 [Cyprinus carpio]|nr:hypothetical protein cypCar_00045343 [Cyprinus carpio]